MRMMAKAILAFVLVLSCSSLAAAQTFTAVLTDDTAKGKPQVLGNATFTLDDVNDALYFTIIFRSNQFSFQEITINLGTPKKPGPAIFNLSAAGGSASPIEGEVFRGAEIPQPTYGVYDWDDAIDAMFKNGTFLLMQSPSYPAGITGRIKRY
jgi:hypothetical protein